jgi:2,3-dihydroxybiphenyl 1,2-dioxygenase
MIDQLGYLGFEVSDLAAWRKFATEILGLGIVDDRGDAGFALRMDGHRQRFFVTPVTGGAKDDLGVVGWQVRDHAMLESVASRVRESGVEVTEGTKEQASARSVERLFAFRDPSGIPIEMFCGPLLAAEPFVSPVVRAGFVADRLGLGHLVVSATDREKSRKFYTEVMGFRYSDRVLADIHGYKADIEFFHTNARHHSLAFGDAQRKRMHHFLVEAKTMDEVGLAFDRAHRAGVPIVLTLGRHPNDRMFSFYAKTPSGFQFEFGWGGLEVDDATWKPTTHDRISEWGHIPPQFLAPRPPPAK